MHQRKAKRPQQQPRKGKRQETFNCVPLAWVARLVGTRARRVSSVASLDGVRATACTASILPLRARASSSSALVGVRATVGARRAGRGDAAANRPDRRGGIGGCAGVGPEKKCARTGATRPVATTTSGVGDLHLATPPARARCLLSRWQRAMPACGGQYAALRSPRLLDVSSLWLVVAQVRSAAVCVCLRSRRCGVGQGRAGRQGRGE